MTTIEPVGEDGPGPTPPKRTIISRMGEFVLWVFAPLAVVIAGLIVAGIFGAPQGRAIGIFAALAVLAGGYFVYRPNDRLRMRKARGWGLIYTGLFSGFMAMAASIGSTMPDPPARTETASAPTTGASSSAPTATPRETAEERAARQEQERVAAQEQRRVQYIQGLEREMTETSAQTFLQATETTEQIIIAAALFSALASRYEEGRSLGLSPEQERIRQRFKARLIEWQATALPELRNRFGPAMARRVWRENMEVRTIGTGYRTIDLAWGGFASNANIEDFHTTARENFLAQVRRALRHRRGAALHALARVRRAARSSGVGASRVRADLRR